MVYKGPISIGINANAMQVFFNPEFGNLQKYAHFNVHIVYSFTWEVFPTHSSFYAARKVWIMVFLLLDLVFTVSQFGTYLF